MISRNENIHLGDCRAKEEDVMREEGAKSDQMFVPLTLA